MDAKKIPWFKISILFLAIYLTLLISVAILQQLVINNLLNVNYSNYETAKKLLAINRLYLSWASILLNGQIASLVCYISFWIGGTIWRVEK